METEDPARRYLSCTTIGTYNQSSGSTRKQEFVHSRHYMKIRGLCAVRAPDPDEKN
jgi:hypothetical protein